MRLPCPAIPEPAPNPDRLASGGSDGAFHDAGEVGDGELEFSFRGNCGYESDFEYESPD